MEWYDYLNFYHMVQPQKNLKDYATSKKDMKKGVELIPEENYRLKSEDLYSPDPVVKKDSRSSTTSTADSQFQP